MIEKSPKPNEIIGFLSGKWKTKDIVMTEGSEIQSREYIEIMKIKDSSTVTITAKGYDNGRDLTRDMTIEVGKDVVLKQGTFSAIGSKVGNSISLDGIQDNRTYRFRLYLLGDKFIFERDVIEKGNIVEVQMSYLTRILDL